jgi:multicomponent Na+:H+ antiporter subunit E
MEEVKQNRVHFIKNFIYIFVILMSVWMALTLSLEKEELITGIIVSLILSVASYRSFHIIGFPKVTVKKVFFVCIYIIILFKEIIIANLDVAYRVIHPKIPIKPGIIIIKTGLKQDLAKLILANSITLTPGTFVLDIEDDRLLIHWINVKTENTDEATSIIGERFEKYLRVIFQ